MKVIALFAALVPLSMVAMTHAQTPPNSTIAVKAKAQDKAVMFGGHPTVTQSLDVFVKHLQNKGYAVSHLQRDLNPDGTLKHYSFQVDPAKKDRPMASGHLSVEIEMPPAITVIDKRAAPRLSGQGRSHATGPVSASQLAQSLMVLNAEAFDDGRLDYIKQIANSLHFRTGEQDADHV